MKKLLTSTLILLLSLTGCMADTPKDDQMTEEERNRLMIQQDPDEENRKIMLKNLEESASEIDPILLMDQQRFHEKSGKLVDDQMKKKE